MAMIKPIQQDVNHESNQRLAELWKHRATMPWADYAKGMFLGGQEHPSTENDESKKRADAYKKTIGPGGF